MVVPRKDQVKWDDGWKSMRMGFNRLMKLVEGETKESIGPADYMNLYTTVYNMCTQKSSDLEGADLPKKLYEGYRQLLDEYVTSTVLPCIKAKHGGEFLLSELVKRWSNHKVMVRWLFRFFFYLERYYIPKNQLPTLREASNTCFCDLVYDAANLKVRAADIVVSMIAREREGEQVDRSLLKAAKDFFVDLGSGSTKYYENDLEGALLEDATACYRRRGGEEG